MNRYYGLVFLLVVVACNNAGNPVAPAAGNTAEHAKGSFGYDLHFLKKYHKDLVLLGDDSSGPQAIVLPAYQGRVMTSAAEGNTGESFGWINHELIASGTPAEHINAYGGEERFWLGPEGGQYSVFFKKGTVFSFENWFVPKELDTEPFTVISSTPSEAIFEKEMHLDNYSGTTFHLKVNRAVRLLRRASIDSLLGVPLPAAIKAIGFESENKLVNTGKEAWNKKTGLLSIWILSMLNATPNTTVVIPFRKGDTAALGKIVTDDYFGKVPASRLKVLDGLLLFKADGQHRSKIGIGPLRALPVMASYDAKKNLLTIAQFSLPGARDYVNSLWRNQEQPYEGDAVNAYNDGPINNKQLGSFYELESSSPAAALPPGGSVVHLHRTIHLKGPKADLEKIATKLLGVAIDSISL